MTTEEREGLREKILLQCHAASRFGIPVGRLLRDCQRYGYPSLTADEFERELRHLLSLEFIQEISRELSPVNRHYGTTAKGDDYLDRQLPNI